MTNPPSVASQGSGGTQTYPKGILKKSVQAAFEGERGHHHHHHHHHLPLAATVTVTATGTGTMSSCVF